MPSLNRDRVFVSYSHRDQEWLDKLRQVLAPDIRNDRIDYWDDRELEPGEQWFDRILEGIARARVAVLLVSPNFLDSRFIMEEELPRILKARDEAGLTVLWVPLFGTFYGPQAPESLKPITDIQAAGGHIQPLAELDPASQTAVLLDLCRQIQRLLNPGRVPRNLPFHSLGDLFKGRDEELAQLDAHLRKEGSVAIVQPQAISGLGGIGKTRLALEYAWRHEHDFTAFLFVSANTPDALETNLARLSAPDALDLPEYKLGKQDEQLAAVIRWFQQNKDWLLILDNVDTPEAAAAVQKFVACLSGGHVLITSRLTQWGRGIQLLSLDVIPVADAVNFLLESTQGQRAARPDDARQAEALSERLGCLPLALTHAAAYIGYYAIGFGDYLAEFERNLARVLEYHDHTVIEYETEPEKAGMVKTVATTFFISFDRLGPMEKAILRAASFLAPDPIPLMMFEQSPEELQALVKLWCEESGEEPAKKPVRDAVAELARFSLVTRGDGTFSVHRMVQAVQRDRLDQAALIRWAEGAVRLVNGAFPKPEFSNWPICERLITHVQACAVFIERLDLKLSEAARLLNESGVYLNDRAQYAAAEPLHRQALKIDEQSFGPDHPKVAIRLNNLAQVLQDTNRLVEAEPLMARVVTIFEKSLGENHPNVATALNNLAQLLKATNRLAEAEPLMQRALRIDEQSFGPDHPDVAIRLNNLAQLLKATNRLTEAEPLMRRALAIDEQSFGPDHPKVATDLNNLARLLQATNRLTEAEPLMRRMVEVFLRFTVANGHQHPHLQAAIGNYTALLEQMGYDQAQVIAELNKVGSPFGIQFGSGT